MKISETEFNDLIYNRTRLRSLISIAEFPGKGVCNMLRPWPTCFDREKVFANFKYFSGSYVFPISIEGHTPSEAFRNLPLWEGEYGRRRVLFCEHLLERCHNLIETCEVIDEG